MFGREMAAGIGEPLQQSKFLWRAERHMPAFAGHGHPALAGPNQARDAKSCAGTEHDLSRVLFGGEAADFVDVGGAERGQ